MLRKEHVTDSWSGVMKSVLMSSFCAHTRFRGRTLSQSHPWLPKWKTKYKTPQSSNCRVRNCYVLEAPFSILPSSHGPPAWKRQCRKDDSDAEGQTPKINEASKGRKRLRTGTPVSFYPLYQGNWQMKLVEVALARDGIRRLAAS